MIRKVIKIRASDSPNVRYAQAQIAAGLEPTDEVLIPGVITWGEYQSRRATWDPERACVGLDAEFWEGPSTKMYPLDWIVKAEAVAKDLRDQMRRGSLVRRAKGVGIDSGEGRDKSAWAAVDEHGLIEMLAMKTPDTNEIIGVTRDFMRRHGIDPSRVCFDQGGGGKQHADRLRAQGFKVRTVAFGAAPTLEIKSAKQLIPDKREVREDKYAYKNRRAEMYGELREMLDPASGWNKGRGFGLPVEYTTPTLREQMLPIPLTYDEEGKLKLLPKGNRNNSEDEKDAETLIGLIGHSPDETDALVLACFAMRHRGTQTMAGVA